MQCRCPCSSKISIFSSFWACIAYFLLQFILVIFFQLFACHKHCWGRVCMFALRQFLPQTWEKWWKSSRNWWGHCSFHNKSKIKGLTKLNHRHLLSCNRAFCLFSFFFVFEDILFTELSCYFSISMQAAAWRSNDSGMFANSYCYIPKMCKNFAVFLVARREECS